MGRKAYAFEYDTRDGKLYIIDGVGRIDITHLVDIDAINKSYKKQRADVTVSFTAQMFQE